MVALASRGTSPVQPELVKAKREGASCALGARETGKAVVLYAVVESLSAGCCAAKAIASFAQQSCNPKEPELYILANQHASIERSDASAARQSSPGEGLEGKCGYRGTWPLFLRCTCSSPEHKSWRLSCAGGSRTRNTPPCPPRGPPSQRARRGIQPARRERSPPRGQCRCSHLLPPPLTG